jgi:hypothetical protein
MSSVRKLEGHLSLAEAQDGARRRLVHAAVFSVIGLGLGILLIALLRPPAEDVAVDGGDEGQGAAQGVLPDDDEEGGAQVPDAGSPLAGAQAGEEPVVDPGAPTGDAGVAVVDAGGQAPDAGAPTGDAGVGVAEPTPEPPAADAGAPAEPPAVADDAPWWERAKGRRCKVVFPEGETRTVMREGKLDKDEETTYAPFVEQPVVARIRQDESPEVTVHFVGMHPRNKRPSLAYVTVHLGDGDKKGILPLQISEKQVELRPVGGGAP